jgi:hypothetical protein
MLVQSLPFLAAFAIALFERSSFNEFATWRRLGRGVIEAPSLPTGPAGGEGPVAGGGPVPVPQATPSGPEI